YLRDKAPACRSPCVSTRKGFVWLWSAAPLPALTLDLTHILFEIDALLERWSSASFSNGFEAAGIAAHLHRRKMGGELLVARIIFLICQGWRGARRGRNWPFRVCPRIRRVR